MKSTKAQDVCFILGDLQIEFLQSFGQRFIESLSISSVLKCANKIISIPADDCITFTVRFDDFLEPLIDNIVQVDIGKYR